MPFMTDGRGADAIGDWFGTGPDRGLALMFTVAGLVGIVVTLLVSGSRSYRNLSHEWEEAPAPEPRRPPCRSVPSPRRRPARQRASSSAWVPMAMSTSPGRCGCPSGVRPERAVVTAEREDERARLIAKRALTDRRPGQRAPRRDAHLLEAELERAFVHHDVEELGDVGLEHERGHAGAADALRVDDAVGAGPPQLLLAVLAPGAGDDEQIVASARALRTMNELAASLSTAATSADARSMPAASRRRPRWRRRPRRRGLTGHPVRIGSTTTKSRLAACTSAAMARPTRPHPQMITWPLRAAIDCSMRRLPSSSLRRPSTISSTMAASA